MKKLLVCFLAAIIAMTACSKDEGLNKNAKDEQRQEITITASQINESTKTIREADGKVFWKPGDEINVFFKSDGAKFTSTNTEDAAIVAFNGSLTISSIIGMTEGSDDDNCLWGLYPYDSDATFDGHSIITTLSNNQTGVAGTFADDLFITLARNNSFALAFYNVLSGFKFTVTRDDISSIVFSGNNEETLTGKLKLAFGEDGKPCVQSISEGQTSITLTPENGTFETGKSYYFVFVPTNFTKGFSVTMTTTDTSEGTFTYENSIEFKRNVFKNKSEIDKGVEFEKKIIRALCFTADGEQTISLKNFGGNAPSLQYSYDGNNWIDWDYSALTFGTDDKPKIYIRGNNPDSFSGTTRYSTFEFSTDNIVDCSGNVLWLFDNTTDVFSNTCHCLYRLFYDAKPLKSSPALPATKLCIYCYKEMFSGCTSLVDAPELPATDLGNGCYWNMFSGCTSLVNAPDLPATDLEYSCYLYMFSGCSSLKKAPKLPATQLTESCYCGMFEDCTALVNTPTLPATQLSVGCYSGMFLGCTSLIYAPELPAQELAESCYSYMFYGCTSLINAPELPAKELVKSCYQHMFFGCTSLKYIKALFTTTPSIYNHTYNWTYGVAAQGEFVKSKYATWNVTGIHGVPSGWTVKTYPQDPDESQIPSGRYLSYVANKEISTPGDNYYIYRSYVKSRVNDIGTIEIQFQLNNVGDKVYSILSGNQLRETHEDERLSINKNNIYGTNGSIALSTLGLQATSTMTMRISATDKSFEVNGQSAAYIFGDKLSYITFFSSYLHESDEGIWEEYGGLPEGSKMYYIKIWDSTGKLVYVGYPSSGMNPKTSQKERCWYSNYNGDETMEFPNFNSVSSYLQYGGNYNVED